MVVLASGSAGNCTLVEGARGRLLIDCGLSARETARRLGIAGCAPASIDALVVSHEHSDHVGGAGVFSRRFGVPICTTTATARAAGLTAADVAALVDIEAGVAFTVAGMSIEPFSVPHDAADNVGLVVECDGARLGYATDLGHLSGLAVERLRQCDLLVAEANHDRRMLTEGPYPWQVKQRILGRHGHLSNHEMGVLLRSVAGPRTRHVMLAHLSSTNNRPALALDEARAALEAAGRPEARVHVTRQDRPAEPVQT